MSRTITRITPADHGRRMSLAEFEHAEAEPGRIYELGRGVVTVVDVPRPGHFALVDAIRLQLDDYRIRHPGRIRGIAAGGECKLVIAGTESERHPDLAVYKTPPPGDADAAWRRWVPELVVEVVSPSSRQRDYQEKPEEYLRLGVREYWIVDPEEGALKVLRRPRGAWKGAAVHPPALYRTRLLPGLAFSIGAALDAIRHHP